MEREGKIAKGKTAVGKGGGLSCVGNVCFTADGKIRISIEGESCPKELIEDIIRETIKGAEIEIEVKPPKKEKEAKK